MKWTKLTLTTTSEAIDSVSYMLGELGIEGIEISDNVPLSEIDRQKMFIDILPEINENDETAKISFYIDSEENQYELMDKINKELDELSDFMNLGQRTIEISTTEDTDWVDNWKQYFKPFRLNENIVIKPTWENFEKEFDEDIIIEIDPGTAFGTGSHETTKLCISALKEYINPDTKLLDVGCGSGILSIIGLKLGAALAVGIDVDPIAQKVSNENASINSITSEDFTCLLGDIISDEELQNETGLETFDLIVANILADVIIPLSKVIGKNLKKNGIFVSSGIINTKKDSVKKALLDNGWQIVKINEMNDWVSIIAKKL